MIGETGQGAVVGAEVREGAGRPGPVEPSANTLIFCLFWVLLVLFFESSNYFLILIFILQMLLEISNPSESTDFSQFRVKRFND